MTRRLYLVACILFSLIIDAQQFGGNPPSLKWKQINTDTARVIFPIGLDSQANRVASIVHRLAATGSVSLGNKLDKINIVLQNQTTIPNGYVNLGPYRSEFYMTPAFNNLDQGSIAWADQLALHEYRHVEQFNNFKTGLSKLMSILFGEDGYALASNASVPDWFFEGDAVYQETILSDQGRGRLPRFLNAYPALWQADKKYRWMKLRNGSFKHYVPNHYYLGYLLVNYGYEKYGNDFWKKVTNDAAGFKGLFYPFQHAIKKHAGIEYKRFISNVFDFYKKQFQAALRGEESKLLQLGTAGNVDDMSMKNLTREMQMNGASQGTINQGGNAGIKNLSRIKKNFLTNYYFPYAIGNDSLVYLKTSGRRIPAFYIRSNDAEKKLRARDIAVDEQFSYRNGKIVYAGYETHSRWSWKDYSVIKLLDVHTGEQRNITFKSKYFTPDISPDGKKIAAVLYTENGKNEIDILNTENGDVVQQIKSGDIGLFTDPKFADDNTLVTAVRLPDGKMGLAIADITTGAVERLTDLSFNVVGYPQVKDGMVYFNASYTGNNDVYALRLSDKKIFKVNHTATGSYFPHVNNNKLYYSAFTADGYQLMQTDLPSTLLELDLNAINQVQTRFPAKSEMNILGENFPARSFAVKDYSKGTRLFNFHSWRPYYGDPIFSFSIYGENVLNTLQTEIYYQYNDQDNEHSVGAAAVYGALFPYISIGTQYTFDRVAVLNNNLTKEWNQLDSYIGLSIPLFKSSGRTFKSFNIGTNFVLRNEMVIGPSKQNFDNVNFSYLHHFTNWSQRSQRADQHIYSPFSYSLALNHRHAITEYTGYQFLGSGSITMPGFFSPHSIVLTGSFQQRDTTNPQLFSNRFGYSRGYEGRYFSRMWRLSANYHFPIFYPDWGFANMLYISRIRGNGFYDFTKVYSRDKTITADQRSVGFEMYFDTRWWNQYPLTFGFRISKLLDQDQFDGFKGTVFEFILPVSIIPR